MEKTRKQNLTGNGDQRNSAGELALLLLQGSMPAVPLTCPSLVVANLISHSSAAGRLGSRSVSVFLLSLSQSAACTKVRVFFLSRKLLTWYFPILCGCWF